MSAAARFVRFAALAALVASASAAPLPACAEAGSPDGVYREALTALHDAVRDTAGHATDPAHLDDLAAAQLKLARFGDADRVWRRVLAAHPGDKAALAGAGRVALVRQDDAAADSLLTLAGDAEGAAHDLFVAHLRRHDWKAAAAMCDSVDEGSRRSQLERLDGHWPSVPQGRDSSVPFKRAWPVPLVEVLLNRETVWMAVDPGSSELLVDPAAAHRCKVEELEGERQVPWCGTRVAARNAVVPRLGIAGYTLTDVPASIVSLHKYSLAVNPEGADIGGVIGLTVLERLGVTIDFKQQRLELRADRGLPRSAHVAARVPFEHWDENRLVVYGSLQGGRRMALWVGTGLPEAALGAPEETFDEVGAKPGRFANLVRAIGTALQGRPWSQVVVSDMSIGPVVTDHVESWSGAMDSSELWRSGSRIDAMLGPKYFANRRVTFDWVKREMVFEETNH